MNRTAEILLNILEQVKAINKKLDELTLPESSTAQRQQKAPAKRTTTRTAAK